MIFSGDDFRVADDLESFFLNDFLRLTRGKWDFLRTRWRVFVRRFRIFLSEQKMMRLT